MLESIGADLLRNTARRVMDRCDALAACTDKAGDITRLFCSPAMRLVHENLRGWMELAGLACRLDPAGNLIGRFDGTAASGSDVQLRRRALLIGSHLDTVINAGRY